MTRRMGEVKRARRAAREAEAILRGEKCWECRYYEGDRSACRRKPHAGWLRCGTGWDNWCRHWRQKERSVTP